MLLDCLAGNGTFSRVVKSLYDVVARYIGNDVSFGMAMEGIKNGEPIVYSDLRRSILKDEIADFAICCYGSHHIPVVDRQEFINACYRKLKTSGTFVLQDFEEESTTARWYSEVIDRYRSCGHRYKHFSRQEFKNLLQGACFKSVDVEYLYDPFVLQAEPGENEQDLLLRFYKYLIALFSLDKLLPLDCLSKSDRLKKLNKVFKPYFSINKNQLANCFIGAECVKPELELFDCLTMVNIGSKLYVVAPRIVIAAVGSK